uniref:Chromosome 2 open reading frame, human C17orf80 n=1 Tax=Monodelphis domestica TaxID=13616 RepID=A0A5F8GSK2_MONDO
MADILTKMELCPYCRKQFKRLKSHLPYCKKIRPILSDSNITSKAVILQAPKIKELWKKSAKANADGEESCKESQRKRRNTNLIKDKLHIAAFEMGTNVQTNKDLKKQIKQSPQMTQTPPRPRRVFFLDENRLQLSAAKKFTRYLPKPKEDKSKSLSEIWGSNSSECSSIKEDKRYPSSFLNYMKIEQPGQKILAETLDLPFSDQSFPSLERSQNPSATLQSNERGPKTNDPISETSSSVNNSETQRRNIEPLFTGNLYKALQIGGMENYHIKHGAKKKEFHCGLDATRKGSLNRGFEGINTSPEAEVLKLDYVRAGPKKHMNNSDLAMEKIPYHDDDDDDIALLSSRGSTHEKFLSLAEFGNQSLSALVLRYLQEEEDGYQAQFIQNNPLESKKPISSESDSDSKSWVSHTGCHRQSVNPDWHGAPKNLINGHVKASDNKSLPRSMGLEWFPELYPGYQHLRVLPRKPKRRNTDIQKPHHNFPEMEGFLNVPLLEKSLMDIKIGNLPSWLTMSNFSLMGLLGTVQKAWIKYQKYNNLKKGSVGGITMLFAGYCVLCYSWSFKHLTIEKSRKTKITNMCNREKKNPHWPCLSQTTTTKKNGRKKKK